MRVLSDVDIEPYPFQKFQVQWVVSVHPIQTYYFSLITYLEKLLVSGILPSPDYTSRHLSLNPQQVEGS